MELLASDDMKIDKRLIQPTSRINRLIDLTKDMPDVRLRVVDVSSCRKPDGSEDWDMETPLMLEACGKFDAMFSSEISYDDYFRRAYPFAEHVVLSSERSAVNISATKVRAMEHKEAREWIV